MKVLIFGGSGLVGSRFIQLNKDLFEIFAPDFSKIDILKADQINKALGSFKPDIVINFAAFTDVRGAEKQRGDKNGICYQINVNGAKNVADACESWDVHLIHISTDYVFDGKKTESPYTEEDKPNPINWYGQTKHLGDQFVLESGCVSTLVRISMPYSRHYQFKTDLARFFLEQLAKGSEISAIEDQRITPTLVDDIANALRAVIEKKSEGIYHICATNDTSPFEFAKLLARTFALNEFLIKPISLDEYQKGKIAPLLRYSRLNPSKFISEFGENILHSVEEGIEIFKKLLV